MHVSEPSIQKNKIAHTIVYVWYFIFLLSATIYVYKRPAYNWDMLAYMAVAISADNHSTEDIHRITYSTAKEQVPADVYANLTDTLHPFKKKVTAHPAVFQQQLPYYVVKPLYVGMIYIGYKAGVPLVAATLLPSVLSYFFIGLLLLVWLRRHLSVNMSVILSMLVMISAPLVHTAELSTPDCLSALLLLYAFYFIVEKKRMGVAYLFLLLAVFARLDNVIVAAMLILFPALGQGFKQKIWVKQMSMMGGLMIAYFIVTFGVTHYGWSILFVNSFWSKEFGALNGFTRTFNFKEFILLRHSALMVSMLVYHLFIYLSVAVFLFIEPKPRYRKTLSPDQVFMLVLLAAIAIRLVVFPNMADRFYIAYYIIIMILLVRKIAGIVHSVR